MKRRRARARRQQSSPEGTAGHRGEGAKTCAIDREEARVLARLQIDLVRLGISVLWAVIRLRSVIRGATEQPEKQHTRTDGGLKTR